MPNLARQLHQSSRFARRVVGCIGHVAFEMVASVLSAIFFGALLGLFGVPAALGALVAIILLAAIAFGISRRRRPSP